jgi:hypothetical protein
MLRKSPTSATLVFQKKNVDSGHGSGRPGVAKFRMRHATMKS